MCLHVSSFVWIRKSLLQENNFKLLKFTRTRHFFTKCVKLTSNVCDSKPTCVQHILQHNYYYQESCFYLKLHVIHALLGSFEYRSQSNQSFFSSSMHNFAIKIGHFIVDTIFQMLQTLKLNSENWKMRKNKAWLDWHRFP